MVLSKIEIVYIIAKDCFVYIIYSVLLYMVSIYTQAFTFPRERGREWGDSYDNNHGELSKISNYCVHTRHQVWSAIIMFMESEILPDA